MSRLLIPHEANWYEELHSVAYYGESDFERQIKQYLDEIFPAYYSFPLKKEVKYIGSKKKPDMGLLRKDFKEWWVIEIELENHSFLHVKSQVETFQMGEYNSILFANYIQQKIKILHNEDLNVEIIRKLINDTSPKILVIVDKEKSDWKAEFSKLDINVCTMQSYKAYDGKLAYRLVGEYPYLEQSNSHCRYHKAFKNTLEIHNPAILDGYLIDTLEILFDGRLTLWKINDMAQKNCITFLGSFNPLPDNYEYVIIRDSESKFYIKKA